MGMSQGTYTFLACFAGFWLVWAVVAMLCCFCSSLQRRLKRRHEERLRQQCLRSVETEQLSRPPTGHPAVPPPPSQSPQLPGETPQFGLPQSLSPPLPLQVPHPMPQANWATSDPDVYMNPPCYEEAVLMEDPPPPYSQVLSDPRGDIYFKLARLRAAPQRPPLRKSPYRVPVLTSKRSRIPPVFPERGYSSLIRLPSSQCWDSLGHLLSSMDLNHNNVRPPGARPRPRREPRTAQEGTQGLQGATQGSQGGSQGLRGLEPSCGQQPTACPLLGRSTAV